MEKLIQQLSSLNYQLDETDHETEAVTTLPFYSIFKQDNQRQIDLNILHNHKRGLLSEKLAIMDSLQIQINLLKVDISNEMRELTLKTNQKPIAS